jgi:hypothetical protein
MTYNVVQANLRLAVHSVLRNEMYDRRNVKQINVQELLSISNTRGQPSCCTQPRWDELCLPKICWVGENEVDVGKFYFVAESLFLRNNPGAQYYRH